MAQMIVAGAVAIASLTVPALERPEDGGRVFEPPPTADEWDGTVDYWLPFVERYWLPEDVSWALTVMDCESEGDPYAKNPNSSASGLFQQLGRFWPERAASAGWAGASVFDPEANIAVSAWLFSWGGSSHWVCGG